MPHCACDYAFFFLFFEGLVHLKKELLLSPMWRLPVDGITYYMAWLSNKYIHNSICERRSFSGGGGGYKCYLRAIYDTWYVESHNILKGVQQTLNINQLKHWNRRAWAAPFVTPFLLLWKVLQWSPKDLHFPKASLCQSHTLVLVDNLTFIQQICTQLSM